MTVIAVIGSGAVTTTAAALAVEWPRPSVLVELDPSGGDLGAWWDLPAVPGLSSAVASAPRSLPQVLEHVTRVSETLAVLAAPLRRREAAAAVEAAVRRVVPILAAAEEFDTILDVGLAHEEDDRLRQAEAVVVVARQVRGRPTASAARIERLAEVVAGVVRLQWPTVTALVGADPYPAAEVGRYLGAPVCMIADDPAGADALMCRPSSSRSRLAKSVRPLVSDIRARLDRQAAGRR